jgi:gamma-D-glutamyl-L-lysine dipeptidyl-peptidase
MRCAVEVAALRAEPREAAEQVTQALLDEPLCVEERAGGWLRVLTVYDYPGWVREEALEGGEGGLPTPLPVPPLEVARGYLGAPYEWGGLTAQGIDCSGLVHIAYRLAGRLVPRDAWQQERAGVQVDPGKERAGDLVAYGATGRAEHVAFLLDGRRILHATAREGLGVVVENEPDELAAARLATVRLWWEGRFQTGDVF